jgi:acyl-homoserine lactone acylase PvdQ
VEDLFVERFRRDGRYEYKGAWLEPEISLEEIKVKGGGAPVQRRVVRTVVKPENRIEQNIIE